ncbi:restriction endonuclease subunit S [Lactobacillus sp. PV037]|uniref:restriction endonuclease subunit S n=1 Tax=unclassified Lactobacillus TaxID=2620435 RepID=UPI00223FE333|nr:MULTISPECIES: restriction endonuclease subunit S [unclassified Lactobacillus]QNQ82140.1 restriction endonuclease subunit S [Lactobacillus sp. PV012]QNQ83825.1 restriction endonuclease subunit S [Lactobacillus sp. PV037]
MNKVEKLKADVQGLREKILDLAMRGKLVKQDVNDEPASVLLEKIRIEKEQLIKEKKIKKAKPLPEITDEEKPFDIPDSWEWVRLGEIGEIISGGTPKTKEKSYWENGNIPWITPAVMSEVKDEKIFRSKNIKYINEEGLAHSSAKLIPANSLVVSSRAPIGYINLVPFEYTTNQGCKSVTIFGNTSPSYLYNALKFRVPDMEKRASGTTFKEISGTKFGQTIIPLPPLNEQKRIAAKIEELFALLNTIEQAQKKYEDLQGELKEKILSLGIQGKLVDQDKNDESASILVEQINAKKEQLIKEKKIKKTKPLPEITDEEKPFDIPDSWEWVRLGDVSDIQMGQAPKGTNVNEKGIGYEFHQGKTEFTDEIIGKSSKYTTDDKKLINSDYILMAVRAPVGDVNLTDRSMVIGRGLAGINGLINNKKYIFYYLASAKTYFETNSTGSTFKAVNGNVVKNTPVPLPPLNEQKRIATKIEELFSTIDN